jgi:Acetyltransferase (GNAT) domain
MTIAFAPSSEAYLATQLDGLIATKSERNTRRITAEIISLDRLGPVHSEWNDLVARAFAPNVFMDPKLLHAAATVEPASLRVAALAWKTIDGRRKLAGIWIFAIGSARRSVLTTQVLNAPAYTHGYLASPVIDRECLDDTLEAMLDCIAGDRHMPKIISLDTAAIDDVSFQALQRVLAARGTAPCIFEKHSRPILKAGLDGKSYLEKAMSSSSRKKLRQHRRRLSEKGLVESVIARDPASVSREMVDFLALEAAGWKGREGTALLCNPDDAIFFKETMRILAQVNCASIYSIRVDQRPVSMQIVVRSGDTAFTWKTAYDEAYRDYSPGMLLWEDYTLDFLADETIRMVDSCSFDDSGFMSAWLDRREIGDVWIDTRRGGSLEFRVLCRMQKMYRDMRATAKSIRKRETATYERLQKSFRDFHASAKASYERWRQPSTN